MARGIREKINHLPHMPKPGKRSSGPKAVHVPSPEAPYALYQLSQFRPADNMTSDADVIIHFLPTTRIRVMTTLASDPISQQLTLAQSTLRDTSLGPVFVGKLEELPSQRWCGSFPDLPTSSTRPPTSPRICWQCPRGQPQLPPAAL